jgi:hypothetical protein
VEGFRRKPRKGPKKVVGPPPDLEPAGSTPPTEPSLPAEDGRVRKEALRLNEALSFTGGDIARMLASQPSGPPSEAEMEAAIKAASKGKLPIERFDWESDTWRYLDEPDPGPNPSPLRGLVGKGAAGRPAVQPGGHPNKAEAAALLAATIIRKEIGSSDWEREAWRRLEDPGPDTETNPDSDGKSHEDGLPPIPEGLGLEGTRLAHWIRSTMARLNPRPSPDGRPGAPEPDQEFMGKGPAQVDGDLISTEHWNPPGFSDMPSEDRMRDSVPTGEGSWSVAVPDRFRDHSTNKVRTWLKEHDSDLKSGFGPDESPEEGETLPTETRPGLVPQAGGEAPETDFLLSTDGARGPGRPLWLKTMNSPLSGAQSCGPEPGQFPGDGATMRWTSMEEVNHPQHGTPAVGLGDIWWQYAPSLKRDVYFLVVTRSRGERPDLRDVEMALLNLRTWLIRTSVRKICLVTGHKGGWPTKTQDVREIATRVFGSPPNTPTPVSTTEPSGEAQ